MTPENLDQCEEHCRNRLDALKEVLFSPVLLNSNEPKDYWDAIQTLHEHYSDSVGDHLIDMMLNVWLEFLDERQQRDETVIMKVIYSDQTPEQTQGQTQEQTQELTQEHDDNSCPDNKTISEAPLLLRLQLTWGRVFVFCRYWVNCRNKTIEFLYSLVEALERKRLLYYTEKSGASRLVSSEIGTEDEEALQRLHLKFASLFRRDVKCYVILLRKLKEVLTMVSSRRFTDTLAMTPKELFQAITALRSDLKEPKITQNDGFRRCSTVVRQGLSSIAMAFNTNDEPHLHLTTFLSVITNGEPEVTGDVRRFIKSLTRQRDEAKHLVSPTIIGLKEVVSNMNNDADTLRLAIPGWLEKRDGAIACLSEIQTELEKIARGVAIAQTVGSSVGVVGGVIGIVGLVLAPFTAGASLLPTVIAGTIVAGAGAATGITATIAEMVMVKKQMETAMALLQEDADQFETISRLMRSFRRSSMLLLRYIPHDELERSISLTTDSDIKLELKESPLGQASARFLVSAARAMTVGGNALAASVTRLAFAGSIATSRVAMMILAHGLSVIGLGLDAANLVIALRNLFKDGRSPCAVELQRIVSRLEEEKETVGHFIDDVNSD